MAFYFHILTTMHGQNQNYAIFVLERKMITHTGWLNTCNKLRTTMKSGADPQNVTTHQSVSATKQNKQDRQRAYNGTISVFKAVQKE